MKNPIIIYYSRKGSNRFLAEKIANHLTAPIEQIRPRLNVFFFQLLFTTTKMSLGIKKLKHNLAEYDEIILCGPIWMGSFIAPLRNFIKRYRGKIKSIYFVTCCGSGFDIKDQKFGHGIVFEELKKMLGEKCAHCEAFPIGLVVPEDKKEDQDFIMSTHLSESNFEGEIERIFNLFMQKTLKTQI